MTKGINCRLWGIHSRKPVHLIRLENEHGAYVELTDFGARIVSIVVPDKYGKLENIVLGFSELEAYIEDNCYIGSTIGPFANRISNSAFYLEGEKYAFEPNDGRNLNHSGTKGFHSLIFDFALENTTVIFKKHLKDKSDGFPGNREVEIHYTWSDQNELLILHKMTSDKNLPVSMTNHAYFNLSGKAGSIGEHRLKVSSSVCLELNSEHLPSGRYITAQDKLFNGEVIKHKFGDVDQKLSGLNTFFVLSDTICISKPAAILTDEESGRIMEVYTDLPVLLLYTGEFLQSRLIGHNGRPYQPFDGLCLECQNYPDSPGKPGFPSAIVNASSPYNHQIKLKFSHQ